MAITRVMVGPLDDGGRPTLERRTMIVSAADYLAIRHDLKALIKDNVWGSSAFAGGLPIQVPSGGTSRRGAADADRLTLCGRLSAGGLGGAGCYTCIISLRLRLI